MAVVALAGCGGSTPAPPSIPRVEASPVESEIPRAGFAVVPAELADEGVLVRLRHRVLLRRWTRAHLRRDDAATALELQDARPADEILPVIDEVPHALRVVLESDDARYAVWISRADAAPTVLATTRLLPADAKIPELAGAWLEPGVRLALLGDAPGARRVRVVDSHLVIEGRASRARVGTVWVVPPGGSLASDMARGQAKSWEVPSDRGPLVMLAPRTAIRGRAGLDGALLATLKDDEFVAVRHAAPRDGWTEVEVIRPHVRVRGFVEDADVLGAGESMGSGSMSLGSVSTHSHRHHHQLGEGTCLYDRTDGDVIGVQLEPKERLGGRLVDGWAMVYVQTPWARAAMYVKNIASDASSAEVWDTCTGPPHR